MKSTGKSQGAYKSALIMVLKFLATMFDELIDAIDRTEEALTKKRDAYAKKYLGFGSPPPLSLTPEEARRYKRNDTLDFILWVSVGLMKILLFFIGLALTMVHNGIQASVRMLEVKSPRTAP